MAEKLKQEGQQETIQAGMTEELEDEDGNVYNRKVSPAYFFLFTSSITRISLLNFFFPSRIV